MKSEITNIPAGNGDFCNFQIRSVVLLCGLIAVFSSCLHDSVSDPVIRSEKITYYGTYGGILSDSPYKTRFTYYFDNGLPHRWVEYDTTGEVLTDFIYRYDDNGIRVGATYKEPGEYKYSLEKVSYSQDSMIITTEWVDSMGQVYYTMVEYLDELNRPYRASFAGEEMHGYDTIVYTPEGFEERIFFTNTSGRVLNDRTFTYPGMNDLGDWTERHKLMADTLQEVQRRWISYSDDYISEQGIYYEGHLSSPGWDENKMTMNEAENVMFFTRGKEWTKQVGYISKKKNGLFLKAEQIVAMDTFYNGTISPSGDVIFYCKRKDTLLEIWSIERIGNEWHNPRNLTGQFDMEGGYFHWSSEREFFFRTPANEGDLAIGETSRGRIRLRRNIRELNTKTGNEFSPFVSPDRKYIIFTRHTPGDLNNQGFFISYNLDARQPPYWSEPVKIEKLPYGWGAYVSRDGRYFHYTDGEDIYKIPMDQLNLEILTASDAN